MKRLEIIPVGNAEFPRFIIQNTGGRVFDGEKMVSDRNKAMVFAEGRDIALAFNALQDAMFKDCPLTEFTVALNIRVRAGEPFTKQQLAEYLERACCIMLDHDKGTGPVEDSMVQLDVTWAGLVEKTTSGKKGKV
jgi:hypothetical protein